MTLTYHLSAADWSAFHRHLAKRSAFLRSGIRRRQLGGTVLIMVGAVLVALWQRDPLAMLGGALIAVCWLVAAPEMFREGYVRAAERLFAQEQRPCWGHEHQLTASAEGLTATCIISTSRVPWSAVHGISETDSHLFVHLTDTCGWVIPRAQVTWAEYAGFLQTLQAQVPVRTGT